MNDPKQKLSDSQIRDAGLTDWRQLVPFKLRAHFDTGDFATGMALLDQIGSAAEEANHHPDLLLTYPRLIVTLSSHDVGGITSRDIDLARQISAFAADAGVQADTQAVTEVEWGLDTSNGTDVIEFWAAICDATVADGEIVDPTGVRSNIWLQEHDDSYQPTEGEVEQRWHPDIWVGHDEAQSRIDRALSAGGTMVDDSHAPRFWVLADAQGNRACICTSQTRG